MGGLLVKMVLFFIIGLFIDVLLVSVVKDNSIAVALVSYLVGFSICFILAATSHLD